MLVLLSEMKIGTPENPEIIEPAQDPRRRRDGGRQRAGGRSGGGGPFGNDGSSGDAGHGGFLERLRRALRILGMMIKFSIPAFFLDSVCIWLFDYGRNDGSIFAWLLLLLLIFPAVILSGLAVVVDLFLTFAFFATLSGRTVSVVQAPFAKFVRYPGGMGGAGGGGGWPDPSGGGGGARQVRDVTPLPDDH